MNMLSGPNAIFVVRILVSVDLIFSVVSIITDLWCFYLESHTSMISNWINDVEQIKSEPSVKIVLVGHLIICLLQSYALTFLYRSASEAQYLSFKRNFMLNFYLLGAEHGLFLAYLVLTWNHYMYLFITLTFMSLAYKSIVCWPLYEFLQILTPSIEITFGDTSASNINLNQNRFTIETEIEISNAP